MQSTFHKDTYIVCQTIFYLYTSLQNAKYIKVSIKKKLKVECKILCKNYKQTRSEEAEGFSGWLAQLGRSLGLAFE